jgi:4'-phosphopantetheinyl transferase
VSSTSGKAVQPLSVVSAAPVSHRDLLAWLDETERGRLARLRRTEDRDRFATSRALLKDLVAAAGDVAPETVRLGYTCARCGRPHGRPVVLGPPQVVDRHVSLSHAGERVVVAVTTVGPVGVDVEPVAAGSFPGFSDVALTDAEAAWVDRAPLTQRDRLRTAYWVRKESVLKATGHGLSIPATTVEVTPPDQPAEVVAWYWSTAAAGRLQLWDIDVGRGYVGSVAVLSRTSPVLELTTDVHVRLTP